MKKRRKMKRMIVNGPVYALPAIMVLSMIIHWIVYGYSNKGKIVGFVCMMMLYAVIKVLEEREYKRWKRKRLKG